jgi:hypothetical protein
MKKENVGALIDTRPKQEKEKDFLFEEIVAQTDQVIWQTKPENAWRKFPIKNQESSNQCVAFSIAKMLGIQHLKDEGEWIDFSATHLYERRSNFPFAGMGGNDVFEIARKDGTTLEVLYPNKTHNNDNERLNIKNHLAEVGKIFTISNYVFLPIQDIETVASVIQRTGKGVMVWYWGTYAEWVRDIPEIRDRNINIMTAPVRHSVVATDYFIHNGKKALLIEDSWGLNHGMKGRRIITEDFHRERNYFAGHIMNFKFGESKLKDATFTLNTTLQFGQRNNQVIELQKMLQHEGFFPINVSPTNYYGSITARAVLEWQLKHKVAPENELRSLAGRSFGPASLKKVKELY